ncbi:MAG: ATP-binding cassette domain-containing protein [Rhizobiaceae bacterium]
MAITLEGRHLLSLDTQVEPGETLTLMGPSGSGKSSLLAYIGGFLDPVFTATGDIILDGQPLNRLPASKRRTGILFQDPLLFPHMSVGENLLFALPPSVQGVARKQQVEAALEQVGLDGFISRDPATLSGGQKARVALMRVLLSKPSALLLDEPFSKLDSELRGQIRSLVFDEARRQNLPTILVTHDGEDAKSAGGPIIRLD